LGWVDIAVQHFLDGICAVHYFYDQRGKQTRDFSRPGHTRTGAPTMKDHDVTHEFQDIQKYGKEQFDAATAATTSFTKTLQAIATETADYSKKSFETGSAFVEKLLGAKSYESATQIQTDYWKSSYAGFVAEATKLGELYSSLAKEAFKPIETAFSKVQGGKA
jgi:hypothetical protein